MRLAPDVSHPCLQAGCLEQITGDMLFYVAHKLCLPTTHSMVSLSYTLVHAGSPPGAGHSCQIPRFAQGLGAPARVCASVESSCGAGHRGGCSCAAQ